MIKQWQDRLGTTWLVKGEEWSGGVDWNVFAADGSGGYRRNYATLQYLDDDGNIMENAKLLDVHVIPANRDRGKGTMLVKTAIDEAKRQGCQRVWGILSHIDKNELDKLNHLYRKLGFVVTLHEQPQGDIGRIELVLSSS